MTTPDPVDQARAWLEEKTGQRVPPAPGVGGEAVPGPRSDGRRSDDGVGGSETLGGSEAPGFGSTPATTPSDRTAAGYGSSGLGRSDQGSAPPAPAEPDIDPVGTARAIALRKLTASARTRHELDQALQKKAVPDEIVTTVLDRLEEVGLVDDQAFAQSWVESRQQRRHLSRSVLRRELSSKGVDRDHVDAALATVDAEDELTAARALVAKKAAATRGLDPEVRDRRLAGVLGRRGFGSGIIATVLAELRANGGA